MIKGADGTGVERKTSACGRTRTLIVMTAAPEEIIKDALK